MKKQASLSLLLVQSVFVVVTIAGIGGDPLVAADVANNLPVNQWVKRSNQPIPGYMYSSPIYVPSRGQVLHWGAAREKWSAHPSAANAVRAFDPAAGNWVDDYASDPKPAIGATYKGWGAMLPSGNPASSDIVNGVCYDSKRDRLIYTMPHLMAAYDPKTKTWQDLGAKTVMPYPVYDHDWAKGVAVMKTEIPGGPPVHGVGTGYDPENDEIVLFPHFDAKNITLRDATGQITGHYGTFRYSFKDNTWRLVSDTFGSAEVKASRKGLIPIMAKASAAMDVAWLLGRKPDAAKGAEAAKELESAANEIEKLALPADAKTGLAPVVGLIKSAMAALTANKPGEAVKPLREALWAMNDALDGALRVEPPPRCATPLVYDPKSKCLVMFGGLSNIVRTDLPPGEPDYRGLDDTWLYDVKTQQWREISTKVRPPRGSQTLVDYDPESGLVLLVTLAGGGKDVNRASLWTLDVTKGEWSKRDEQDWPGLLGGRTWTVMAFDAKARLLLTVSADAAGGVQTTCAMKLDLGKLPAPPTPAGRPMPPIKPYEQDLIEDPAWVAQLKELPANTWVQAKPPREAERREWGIMAVDPVRGCLMFFGGGHSSRQVNDVAVYSVGGNRWTTGVGGHNDNVPLVWWEGSTLDFRGGPPTGHQRNTYQAFDGRMYISYGMGEQMPSNYVFHADRDYVRFYDVDRGGVWRDVKIANIEQPEGVPARSSVNLTDPRGRIMNLIFHNGKAFFKCYDLNEDKLVVREIPKPYPPGCGESRPYCYLPDKDQVLYVNWSVTPNESHATWLYDLKANTFAEAKPKHELPRRTLRVVEYAQHHKHALAALVPANGKSFSAEFWAYSTEKNDWALLETKPGIEVHAPYGQLVWVEKYGVFVNFDLHQNTWVMRPDFNHVKWEK